MHAEILRITVFPKANEKLHIPHSQSAIVAEVLGSSFSPNFGQRGTACSKVVAFCYFDKSYNRHSHITTHIDNLTDNTGPYC
jgi:hypothetical protein